MSLGFIFTHDGKVGDDDAADDDPIVIILWPSSIAPCPPGVDLGNVVSLWLIPVTAILGVEVVVAIAASAAFIVLDPSSSPSFEISREDTIPSVQILSKRGGILLERIIIHAFNNGQH